MIPHYHPRAEWLLSYAAGSLDDAQAVVVAAHLHYCLLCQKQVAAAGAVATALFESMTPVSPSAQCFDRLMRRLDQAPDRDHASSPVVPNDGERSAPDSHELPPIIQRIFNRQLLKHIWDDLPWRFITTGLYGVELTVNDHDGSHLWLLKCKGGRCLGYDHQGSQLALIIEGSYISNDRHFRVGDVDEEDDTAMHRPRVADGAECIFLAAMSGVMQSKSRLPHFLQRMLG